MIESSHSEFKFTLILNIVIVYKMATTALYIDPDVPNIRMLNSALKSTVVNVENLEDVLSLTGINRVGLMYVNDSKFTIPYLHGDDKLDKKNPAYKKRQYYSNNFVKYLIDLKEKFTDVTFDLITCNMNSSLFLKETKEVSTVTGVQIEYSLNQTGNGNTSDWVLESNEENLKDIYFTDVINSWKYVLDSTILSNNADILNAFNTIWGTTGTLTYNSINKTYKLLKDVEISEGDFTYPHIQLNNGEVFDGNNHTITQNYNSTGFFVINSSTLETTIKHLTIGKGSTTNYINGGGIVRNGQSNFTVYKCTSTGHARNNNFSGMGGIVGYECNNFRVIKCVNNGDFSNCYTNQGSGSGGCGGIVGANCYNYKAIKCINNAPIGSFDENIPNYSF